MLFKKGQSGNPKGRPRGTFNQKKLEAAIKKVERDHPELPKFLEDTVLRSYKSDRLRKALIDKLIPSLRAIEAEFKGAGFSRVEVHLHKEDGSVVHLGDGSGDTNGESRD